ncbi:MAG: hypothetical protein EXS68_00490 [Candidatus Ryanbacteria bacterium]|nr:hypothetical protein [Candidatus Ryanbacteria bacterium]
MVVTRGSWHFYLFHFGLLLVDMFTGREELWEWKMKSYESRFKGGTNLCHYMRVILVYTPLILAAYAATALGLVWAAVFLPIKLFGIVGYTNTIFMVGVVVISVVLAIVAMVTVWGFFEWVFHRSGEAVIRTRIPNLARRGWNFGELLAERAIAKKKAICPQLTFVGAQSSSEGDVS